MSENVQEVGRSQDEIVKNRLFLIAASKKLDARSIQRSKTRGKPPGSYFDGWEKITNNHAAKLRQMVRNEL